MINIGDLMRAMADNAAPSVPQEQPSVRTPPSGGWGAVPDKSEIYDFATERQIPMYVAVRFYEYYRGVDGKPKTVSPSRLTVGKDC